MATSSSARAAAQPILQLYRQILQVHKVKLAGPLREIGDDYVKSEFKQHLRSSKTTQAQWGQFVAQWKQYLSFIDGTADDKAPMIQSTGELREEVLEAMSEDQRRRMEMLREEAKAVLAGDSASGSYKDKNG